MASQPIHRRPSQVPVFHGSINDLWHLDNPPLGAARCSCPEGEGGVASKDHPERCVCGRWRLSQRRSGAPDAPCRCVKSRPITDQPRGGKRWQVRWIDEAGAQRAKAYEHYWQAEIALEELRVARCGSTWTPVYDRHGNPLGYVSEALIRHTRPTGNAAGTTEAVAA